MTGSNGSITVAVIQVAYDDDETGAARIARVSELVRAVAAPEQGPAPDLIVLPELWVATGFDYSKWEDAAEPIDGPFVGAMQALAAEVGVVLHAGSFVERLSEPGVEGRTLANTSVLIDASGEVVATYRKVHRFGFGSGEPKLMEAGSEVVVLPLAVGGQQIRLGLATCYDLRFPELFRRMLDAGAEAFVVSAAFTVPTGEAHWHLLLRTRAVENLCALVAAAQVGTHQNGRQTFGHSAVIDCWGRVLAELPAGEGLALADVDFARQARVRSEFPALEHRVLGRTIS